MRDLHLDDALVWAHGGGRRTEARWVHLDSWSVDALRRRVADLTATRPAEGLLDVLVAYTPRTPATPAEQRQAAAPMAVAQILNDAGLSETPGVRPASFTEHAAARIWKETGRMEAVAARLGMRSLDQVADLLAQDWRDDWRVPGPQGVEDPDTPVTYAGVVDPRAQRAEQ